MEGSSHTTTIYLRIPHHLNWVLCHFYKIRVEARDCCFFGGCSFAPASLLGPGSLDYRETHPGSGYSHMSPRQKLITLITGVHRLLEVAQRQGTVRTCSFWEAFWGTAPLALGNNLTRSGPSKFQMVFLLLPSKLTEQGIPQTDPTQTDPYQPSANSTELSKTWIPSKGRNLVSPPSLRSQAESSLTPPLPAAHSLPRSH